MSKSEAPRVLLIDEADNVATALVALAAGSTISIDRGGVTRSIVLSEDIPSGHKFALDPLAQGDPVRKYGVVIARATSAIGLGQHVHVHNVESNRGRGDRV